MIALLFLAAVHMQAEDPVFKFEGVLGGPCENIHQVSDFAPNLLPYNPVVVAVGAYEGKGTLDLARAYPYGAVFAFEPHPTAYSLDEWCRRNEINHIHFLRLDAGGLEWQILQSSEAILKTVSVLSIKTHLFPSGRSIVSFPLLKRLLENQGFELLSHWYEEGKEGEALFVQKRIYDSIYN